MQSQAFAGDWPTASMLMRSDAPRGIRCDAIDAEALLACVRARMLRR